MRFAVQIRFELRRERFLWEGRRLQEVEESIGSRQIEHTMQSEACSAFARAIITHT